MGFSYRSFTVYGTFCVFFWKVQKVSFPNNPPILISRCDLEVDFVLKDYILAKNAKNTCESSPVDLGTNKFVQQKPLLSSSSHERGTQRLWHGMILAKKKNLKMRTVCLSKKTVLNHEHTSCSNSMVLLKSHLPTMFWIFVQPPGSLLWQLHGLISKGRRATDHAIGAQGGASIEDSLLGGSLS